MEKYFNILKIKNYEIIGSYKNPRRKFYGDIDLQDFAIGYTATKFLEKLKLVIRKIQKSKDTFFLDFKAGILNGIPVKWRMNEILDGFRYVDNRKINLVSMLLDGSIIKLDIIVLKNKFMIPITINYYIIDQEKRENKNFLNSLYNYASRLKNENNIIGYVKKMELYYRLKGNEKKADELEKILNSKYGVVYKYIGYLDSILILLKSENKGYSVDIIKSNFNEITGDLPKELRHLMIPLNNTNDKYIMTKLIPRIINSFNDYINKGIEI